MDKHTDPVFDPSDWNEANSNPKKEAQTGTNPKKAIKGGRQASDGWSSNQKAMQTLLEKHCPNNAHHKQLIQFMGAALSIGIPENECREFLHDNQSCISTESSYFNNLKQLDHRIRDIYIRYKGDFGKYKSEPLARNPSIEPEIAEEESLPSIPSEVFKALPDLLKRACNVLTDKVEKEVFLIGALGFLSGCLPNVWMKYAGKKLESNLFVYLTTSAGGGKGSLSFAWLLVKAIHDRKREEYKAAKRVYQQDLKKYKKDLREGHDPEEPQEPKNKMLVIPANNSSTGAMELLGNNEGRAIMFETEGDTLANTFKTDYGNYSDCLRKAFHHERITYYRRTDKEEVEIESPYLAAVLSSTFNQLIRLIPSAENGLFSRFIFYVIQPSLEFNRVFDKQKNGYQEAFLKIGQEVEELYQLLSCGEGIEFTFSEGQIERFYDKFQRLKYEVNELVSKNLNGTVNRLGVITARIAMIFTTLRILESGEISDHLECSDQDFNNALRLVEILKEHAIHIYKKLPSANESKNLDSELKKSVYEKLPQEFSRKEVEAKVQAMGMNERMLSRFLKTELFKKIKHGHYQKNL